MHENYRLRFEYGRGKRGIRDILEAWGRQLKPYLTQFLDRVRKISIKILPRIVTAVWEVGRGYHKQKLVLANVRVTQSEKIDCYSHRILLGIHDFFFSLTWGKRRRGRFMISKQNIARGPD
jgi:hypothetical protein